MDSNEDFALVAAGSEFAKINRSCVPSVFASPFLFENTPSAPKRILEYFSTQIRNQNTRTAYVFA